MLKALLILFLTIVSTIKINSFAYADTIYAKNASYEGKIESLSDGLIVLDQKGLLSNFHRKQGNDFYGDYITYKKSLSDKKYEILQCKVFFVDFYNVNIQTPDMASIKIPRYRIKNIELRLE